MQQRKALVQQKGILLASLNELSSLHLSTTGDEMDES
jgi:hypothetical protein